MTNVKVIFNEIQTGNETVVNERTNDLLQALTDGSLEVDNLLCIFDVLLFYGKKSDVLYNLNIFKTIFDELCDSENGKAIIKSIYTYVTKCLGSKYKLVRKNAIMLMGCLEQFVKVTNDILLTISSHLFDRENEVVKEAIAYLKNHQNLKVSKTDHVYDIFVNFIRHSAEPNIRKEVLKHLIINEKTMPFIAEKIIDEDYNVRKYFYENVLHKIDFRNTKKSVVQFIIEKIFTEREFDCKKHLLEILTEQLDLQEDANDFLQDVDILCQTEVLQHLVSNRLINYKVAPMTVIEAKILYEYIISSEDNEVALPESTTYIGLINKELKSEIVNAEYLICILKILEVALLNSYDGVIDTFYSILDKTVDDEIVDTIFMILSRMPLSQNELSEIIAQMANQFSNIVPLICKYTAKHFSAYSAVCKGLLETYKNNYWSDDSYLQALLYYLRSNNDQEIAETIVKSNKIESITDLYLINQSYVDFAFLESLVFETIANDASKAVIPMIKLLMAGNTTHNDFFVTLLQMYFEDIDDYKKQMIATYLMSTLNQDASILIDNFDKLFADIDDKRMFVNQCIFWIKNSKTQNGAQKLFYNICCGLLRNNYSKQSISVLLNALHQIEISNVWFEEMTKKIIYCCAQIVKKLESKALVNELLGNLMTIDNGEPITQDLVDEVKKDITEK